MMDFLYDNILISNQILNQIEALEYLQNIIKKKEKTKI
jgi:hypothetical protein